jgi:hypothetical protein
VNTLFVAVADSIPESAKVCRPCPTGEKEKCHDHDDVDG